LSESERSDASTQHGPLGHFIRDSDLNRKFQGFFFKNMFKWLIPLKIKENKN